MIMEGLWLLAGFFVVWFVVAFLRSFIVYAWKNTVKVFGVVVGMFGVLALGVGVAALVAVLVLA